MKIGLKLILALAAAVNVMAQDGPGDPEHDVRKEMNRLAQADAKAIASSKTPVKANKPADYHIEEDPTVVAMDPYVVRSESDKQQQELQEQFSVENFIKHRTFYYHQGDTFTVQARLQGDMAGVPDPDYVRITGPIDDVSAMRVEVAVQMKY